MKKLRLDTAEGTPAPSFVTPWDKDKQFRMHPEVVTSLLREQVPVLEFVQWRVESIEPGATVSVLPLNPQSTNQHFTHQAALFVLAADYTGGTALASLLSGWPVVGVHPVTSPESVAMWLLKVDVKYQRPSVGDMTVSARIDPDLHDRIRRRFLLGQAVIETITIEFRNGASLIGEAELTYFARQSNSLRAEGISNPRVNTLYELKLTSSAELIAGVRARENGRRVDDVYAAQMAGQHGLALANRFCERSPQLAGMVAARTRHLDSALMNFVACGGRDIVIVGVGWDMRPFRLPLPEGTRVFELDFPTTLAERCRRLAQLQVKEPFGVTRHRIPIDVRTMSLAPVMAEFLKPAEPVFVAWEGMSMYFQEAEVREILAGMMPLLCHPESLLWVDLIDRQAVEHPENYPASVGNFMRGMQILGEPFTFGPESVSEFMHSAGLRTLEIVPSGLCLRGKQDPVYSIYKFCVAMTEQGALSEQPRTFRKTRFDRRVRTANRPHAPRTSVHDSPLKPPRSRRLDSRLANPLL